MNDRIFFCRIPFSPASTRILTGAVGVLVLSITCVCLCIFFENAHFGYYLPQQYAPYRREGHVMPFEPGVFKDEVSWRTLQFQKSGDMNWYNRPLSAGEQKQMMAMVADSARWDRFVSFVRRWTHFSFVAALITIIFSVAVIASIKSQIPQSQPYLRFHYVCICASVGFLVFILYLGFI